MCLPAGSCPCTLCALGQIYIFYIPSEKKDLNLTSDPHALSLKGKDQRWHFNKQNVAKGVWMLKFGRVKFKSSFPLVPIIPGINKMQRHQRIKKRIVRDFPQIKSSNSEHLKYLSSCNFLEKVGVFSLWRGPLCFGRFSLLKCCLAGWLSERCVPENDCTWFSNRLCCSVPSDTPSDTQTGFHQLAVNFLSGFL